MLAEFNWRPDRSQMRSFAWTLLALFPLFGAFLAWRFATWFPLILCAALGFVFWFTALFMPSVGIWLYRAWMGLGYAMGYVVAPVMMAVVYYGVVTPIALVLRAMGKDPMQRRRSPDQSYWHPVRHRTSRSSYTKQF